MYKVKTLAVMLTAFALLCVQYAVIIYEQKPQEWQLYPVFEDQFLPGDMVVPIPDEIDRPETLDLTKTLSYKVRHALDGVEVHYTTTRLESKGWYFITAYCSCSKCCYPSTNYTASGVQCHYADYEHRYDEPTTCAIDRSIHSFGDTFYLKSEDRVYVAEDTGSAVKGRHIDLYFPDHSYVQSYGSHWEEVYDLIIEEHSYIWNGDLAHPQTEHPRFPYWKTQLYFELFGYNLEEKGLGKREEFRIYGG